jgi:integrase
LPISVPPQSVGYQNDSKLRYEEVRDDYIAGGKKLPSNIRRDLDAYFKAMRVSAIGSRLAAFRSWRESSNEVLEYKAETMQKEIALRTMKSMQGRRKPLSAVESAKIAKDAERWVENGVKATTDKRMVYLRAIFNHAFKKTQKISRADGPHFPILGRSVDNVRQGKFSDEDLERIIRELPQYQQLIRFLHLTGMRSGQAASMTWDMIGHDNVLRMPGFLTKNGEPYSLVLTDERGIAYRPFEFMVKMRDRRFGEPVFDLTNFRDEWRRICHKLKLGVFDKKTRSYRGAQLHDFRRTAITNMDAKGVSENASMEVTGHKTNSAHKRYKIGGASSQRAALSAVTK